MSPAASLCLLFALAASSCVTETVGDDGVPIKEEKRHPEMEGPPITDDGLLLAEAIAIEEPAAIRIYRRDSRTLRFAGVAGPDAGRDPALYGNAVLYLQKYLSNQQLYIRPVRGGSLTGKQITGTVLLPSADRKGGYVDVTQGMLSLGLLYITDEGEFQDPKIAAEMRKRQNEAKAGRLGLWSKYEKLP